MTSPFSLDSKVISGSNHVPTLDEFLSFIKTNNLARQERFFVTFTGSNPSIEKDLQLLCNTASLPGKTITPKTMRINGLTERRAGTMDYMGDSITLDFFVDPDFNVRQYMESWMENCVSSREAGNEVGYYVDYVRPIVLSVVMPAGIAGEKLFNFSPTQSTLDSGLLSGIQQAKGKTGLVLNKLLRVGKAKADTAIAKAKSQLTGSIGNALSPAIELLSDTEDVKFSIVLNDCWPVAINPSPLGYDAVGTMRMSVTFTYKNYSSNFTNISRAETEGMTAGEMRRLMDDAKKEQAQIEAARGFKVGNGFDLDPSYMSLIRRP